MKKIPAEKGKVARAGAQGARRAVERVSHDGMADGGEVCANLVRATGVQGQHHERRAVQARDDAPVGARVPASGGASRHTRATARVARNRERDRAGIARHFAVHEREIDFTHVAGAKFVREMLVGSVVPRHDNSARGFSVKAVDDARAQRVPRGGKLAEAMQERVHERSPGVARTCVHHHSGGLVDYDKVLVLVEEFERQIFRLSYRRRSR